MQKMETTSESDFTVFNIGACEKTFEYLFLLFDASDCKYVIDIVSETRIRSVIYASLLHYWDGDPVMLINK